MMRSTLPRPPLLFLYFAFASITVRTSAAEPVQHRVHIAGEGRPAVIFESGLGDTFERWEAVQASIASRCGLTFTYNRAGYPGSDVAEGARDAATIVSELRDELRRKGIAPPYVLVGHSLGGLYMQYFARQFSTEVAGLVLVDSTHWDEQLLMGSTQHHASRSNANTVLFMPLIVRRELADSARAGEQVHTSPPARVRTIVLSSTAARSGETPASRTRAARLQESIVADFPAARHVRVESSGHYIQLDSPRAVIDAVGELAGCKVR